MSAYIEAVDPKEAIGKPHMPMSMYEIDAINSLVEKSYWEAVRKDWFKERMDVCRPIALIHAEISEAVEGIRKELMDSHLPGRLNRDVELADAVLRIFNLVGALKISSFGTIMSEKSIYNMNREDHKEENRQKEGGKKF